MNGEYISLETAKIIKQLETNYKNMQESALQLDRIVKEKQQEIERLNNNIDKAIETIDLIKPELWNISNKMTYKLLDIKNILKENKND